VYDFEYCRPASLDAAATMISGRGDFKLLAGGMSLIPALKMRLARYAGLVDLGGIAGLNHIRRDGDAIVIGAMTPHTVVAASSEVATGIPALASLAGRIGDPLVRNCGTIGGSIAYADPAADYPAAVLGPGATVLTNRRRIAADDFFTGLFETALHQDEIITAVIPAAAGRFLCQAAAARIALRAGGRVRCANRRRCARRSDRRGPNRVSPQTR
jgi:carbon-monoxide dehydrogenase medium subunit